MQINLFLHSAYLLSFDIVIDRDVERKLRISCVFSLLSLSLYPMEDKSERRGCHSPALRCDHRRCRRCWVIGWYARNWIQGFCCWKRWRNRAARCTYRQRPLQRDQRPAAWGVPGQVRTNAEFFRPLSPSSTKQGSIFSSGWAQSEDVENAASGCFLEAARPGILPTHCWNIAWTTA